MHGPATAPTASPATTCRCGAPGVVDPVGAHELCALHAIALIGDGDTPVTLFLDVTQART